MTETAMDGWWREIDEQVLACLDANGSMTPVDIGRRLGLSASAVTSLLCMLAQDGKIHIRLVSAVGDARRNQSAA